MPEIELTYFPIHGFRGLLARMVLDLSELEYTEKNIPLQDWGVHKPSKIWNFSNDSFLIWKLIGGILRKFNGFFAGNQSWWSTNGTDHANAGVPI